MSEIPCKTAPSGRWRRCSSEQRNRCLAGSFDVLSARLVSQGPSERVFAAKTAPDAVAGPPNHQQVRAADVTPLEPHPPQSRRRLLLPDVADRRPAIAHDEEPGAPPARSLRDERNHCAADRGVIAFDGEHSRAGAGQRDRFATIAVARSPADHVAARCAKRSKTDVIPIGVIHQSGRRVWRGWNRPPTEVLADGCIGHRDPDFSDEHRRGSGGAPPLSAAPLCCAETIGPSAAVKRWPCTGASLAWRRRARLVLSALGAVEARRLRDPQREPPPGAHRSTRRPVCGREHCQRMCHAAVGLRRCVVRPRCWPCSTSGPRPDRIGVAASRRSRTRPLVSCCVPSLRALPLEEACELRIRPGRWRSLAPGKDSVAKRSLACLAAMLQLGVLGGFPPVAREAADVPGGARVRVAGENTMLRDAQLRSFGPGARVLFIRQDVRKLASAGSGGPLGTGSVDVGRVMIGTGPDPAVGHVGVGDRPVSRRGAGDRVCCVPEVSRTGQRTLTKHMRRRTARQGRRP